MQAVDVPGPSFVAGSAMVHWEQPEATTLSNRLDQQAKLARKPHKCLACGKLVGKPRRGHIINLGWGGVRCTYCIGNPKYDRMEAKDATVG